MADFEIGFPELAQLFEHSDDEFENFFFEADDVLNFQQPSFNRNISQKYQINVTDLVYDRIDQKSKCSQATIEEELDSQYTRRTVRLTGKVEIPAFVQSTYEPFCKCDELAKVQKQAEIEQKKNEIPKFELPQIDSEGMVIMDFVQETRPQKTLPALIGAMQGIDTEMCKQTRQCTCVQPKEMCDSVCRFCDEKISRRYFGLEFAFNDVCNKTECVQLMTKSCNKVHDCGHICRGFANEEKCMPCLDTECAAKNRTELPEGINGEEYCFACYTDILQQKPCFKLECNHIFHVDCVEKILDLQWDPAGRIKFGFMDCPLCKQRMKATHCKFIDDKLHKHMVYEQEVIGKALARLEHEKMHEDEIINEKYGGSKEKYAMQKLAYYQCYECSNPFYGGLYDCAAANDAVLRPEEMLCNQCVAMSTSRGLTNCEKHGDQDIMYKCRFCCAIATWHCWGTTHFCNYHHDRYWVADWPKDRLPFCTGKKKDCPLKIDHAPNGDEYAIGCSKCVAEEQEKDFF